MDIIKELEQISNSKDYGNDTIHKAIQESIELEKKIQMLRVISLVDKIEDIVATDLFTKDGIEFLQLTSEYDHDLQNHRAEFHLIDKDGGIAAGYYDFEDSEQARALYNIFEDLGLFDFDLANPKLKLETSDFELKPGIKEELLGLLLNTELKNIYDYSKMQLEIPYNDGTNKKMKM